MAYTPVTNLYEVAQDQWTPSQFRDKHVYQSLLRAFTGQVQALEDLFSDMYSMRSLPTAVGVQLDNVGANMGVTRRLNQSDDEYRTAIYAEIFMRRSDGSADYIMTSLGSIYGSTSNKIFEHNTPMTGGVVAVVNQPEKLPSAVYIMKRMAPAAIQSVTILRDPTPLGYAWTPVEVESDTSALVNENQDWFITDGGLGIVVQNGTGQAVKNLIGSMGDPGFQTTNLGLDYPKTAGDDALAINARGGDRMLQVMKETPVGGLYGIMAEVSQLRQGHTEVEGEQ